MVRLGSLDHYEMESTIKEVTIHPKYNLGQGYYDIAVVRISPVEYGSNVRPVCIQHSTDILSESDRWGIVSTIKDSSLKMKSTPFLKQE